MTAPLVIENARLVDGRRDELGWLLVESGLIQRTGTHAQTPSLSSEVHRLDARGAMVTPGLIDLHTHGGGGGSFDSDRSSVDLALKSMPATGVTRCLMSLVSGHREPLLEHVRRMSAWLPELASLPEAAAPLGLHAEGPFLSDERAGAHDPATLCAPSPDFVDALLDAGDGALRYVTLAPEREGGLDAIKRFTEAGVLVGVGHTQADFELSLEAFDAGATLLTHAFNAMAGIHHRAPGPILAAVEAGACLELILDGVHVAEPVAAMLLSTAPGQVALITDAMSAAGCQDGHYSLGALNVRVDGGVAKIEGTETIAGSTLSLGEAVARAMSLGFEASAAVGAATAVPARVLGLQDRFGSLSAGHTADLVLWDEEMKPLTVWREGVEVFSRS